MAMDFSFGQTIKTLNILFTKIIIIGGRMAENLWLKVDDNRRINLNNAVSIKVDEDHKRSIRITKTTRSEVDTFMLFLDGILNTEIEGE